MRRRRSGRCPVVAVPNQASSLEPGGVAPGNGGQPLVCVGLAASPTFGRSVAPSTAEAAPLVPAVGVTPDPLGRWTRAGRLVRVGLGAFVDRRLYQAAAPTERYRLRVSAVMATRL